MRLRPRTAVTTLIVVLLALFTATATAATANPAAPPSVQPSSTAWPATINDLTAEQKKMLTQLSDGTEDLSCTLHTTFPGCAGLLKNRAPNASPSIRYPGNGAPATVSSSDPVAALGSMPSVVQNAPDTHHSESGWKRVTSAVGGCVAGAAVAGPAGCAAGAAAGSGAAPAAAHAVGSAVGSVAGDLANSMFGKVADAAGQAAGDMLKVSMTWWITTDSIDVSYSQVLSGNANIKLLVMLIVILGIMGTGIALMLTRRTQPLAELGMGAMKMVAINGMFLVVLAGALHAGDDFAQSILGSTGAQDFGPNLSKLLGVAALGNPFTVLMLAIFCWALSFIAWFLGFLRQAGIVILAAFSQIAAAGQMTSWGRQWWPRLATALVTLVLYKPCAAMIFVIGFKLMGNGHSLETAVVGVMVIALAVLALPSMLKFFSWVAPSVAGGIGAGAVAAGAVAAAAGGGHLLAGLGGDQAGAEMASYMDSTGPGSGGADPDPTPGNRPAPLELGQGDSPVPGPGAGTGDSPEPGPTQTPDLGGPEQQAPDATGAPQDQSSAGADSSGETAPTAGGDSAGPGGDLGGVAGGGEEAAGGGMSPYLAAAGAAAEMPGQVNDAAESIGSEMTPDDTPPEIG